MSAVLRSPFSRISSTAWISRVRLLLPWILILATTYLSLSYFNHSPAESSLRLATDLNDRPPKITVILIWMDRGTTPIYLPYFFQSVEANPQVNLVVINVDREKRGSCSTFSTASNVKEVCMSEEEYWELHVDFLCKRWQCTQEDRVPLLEHLMRYARDDFNNSWFRILRNGIFRKWIDPATTIWGWCDADTFWGNFERVFPWDIAHEFDVISVKLQPDASRQKERLLVTNGHLAFFRDSPEVLDRMHSYEKFASLAAFLTLPNLRSEAEESQFSHYYFAVDESFTFITIEGLVGGWDSMFLSDRGVFYSNMRKENFSPDIRARLMPLIRPAQPGTRHPTFTPEGVETLADYVVGGEGYPAMIWFPMELAQYVRTGWDTRELGQKKYFMRRSPGGPITKRLEPRYMKRDREIAVDEGMYVHYQSPKHKDWFRRIPAKPLDPNHVLVYTGDEVIESFEHELDSLFDHESGAEIWDGSGRVVFSTNT